VSSKVVVIGQGYVGLPLAIAMAKVGHEVIGYDLNERLIGGLLEGKSHIEGVSSEDLKALISSAHYRPSNVESDISDREIAVIAVPTPLADDRKPDLKYVISASEILGRNLKNSALIVNESTSFPGTLRNYIKPTVEANSHIEVKHLYAISPERVDPGNEKWHIENTPRIVAGLTPDAATSVIDFYSSFCKALHPVSTPEIAEAAKLFENTFRLINIGLVNEFAQIMSALGIPVRETLDAAATKPYGFMKFTPGVGVGGHCIPVDPLYLAQVAHQAGESAKFIQAASDLNNSMPAYVVSRVKRDHGGSLTGKSVRVVGVSYKPNLADIRETPVEILVEELEREGAIVRWHDPFILSWRGGTSDPLAPKSADIAIIATYHDQFDPQAILDSATYTFDCTGKVAAATQL
jgi:UDP-N-acetyl-D-glucosamine dehydrogenase